MGPSGAAEKFSNPDTTAKGQPRASVALDRLETLWINTGTLCNIACVNCYIESSPRNDRLEYIRAGELGALLDEIATLGLATREIAFTGGEPFMNPDMLAMTSDDVVACSIGASYFSSEDSDSPRSRRILEASIA